MAGWIWTGSCPSQVGGDARLLGSRPCSLLGVGGGRCNACLPTEVHAHTTACHLLSRLLPTEMHADTPAAATCSPACSARGLGCHRVPRPAAASGVWHRAPGHRVCVSRKVEGRKEGKEGRKERKEERKRARLGRALRVCVSRMVEGRKRGSKSRKIEYALGVDRVVCVSSEPSICCLLGHPRHVRAIWLAPAPGQPLPATHPARLPPCTCPQALRCGQALD